MIFDKFVFENLLGLFVSTRRGVEEIYNKDADGGGGICIKSTKGGEVGGDDKLMR